MFRPDIMLIFFIIYMFHFTRGELFQRCVCTVNIQEFTVDCSELGLTNMSDIFNCVPNNTRELNLFNNSVSDIPAGVFVRFPSLRSLRLDYNNVEKLKSGAFEGLTQLEELSLNHNNLGRTDSYADDVFKPLRKLRRLNLQGNCNVYTPVCAYPDTALSALTSLQYLHQDGIPNVDFGSGYAKLKNLKTLFLTDENGYCNLSILTENTFKQFRQTPVSFLHLNGCHVRKIMPNVFRELLNLTTLIIVDNQDLCSDSINNATIGLNETTIETVRFNYWCRETFDYVNLKEFMLKGLTNTSLKTLDLGWNRINFIHPKCVDNLPKSLKYISVKENKLDSGRFLKNLRRLDRLEVFDISYQYNNNIEGFQVWNGSDVIDVQTNTTLQKLKNKIGDFKPVYLPENIKTIYMSYIKLGYPVPSLTFGPNKLKYLDSSSCMSLAFLGPWYGLKDLEFYNISNNRFSFFSPRSLTDMTNLKTLLLQNNQIGASLNKDYKGLTFSRQKKLEVLDLSNNVIKDLPYKIFQNQISLRNLSLADNSMKNVSFMLMAMTSQRKLNLSNNEIEYLSSENMVFLDQVAAKGKIDLDLSGNTLACMCNNQDFVNWLATTKVNIMQRDKLLCVYENKTVVSLSRLDFIREQLKFDCMSWIVMTSCVMGFVGLLLLLSLVALIYHRIWQLRYLWYMGRVKIDPYHHPNNEAHPLLKIDAYISYEQHYDVTDEVCLHQVITEKFYPFFEQKGYSLRIREEFDGNEKLYDAIPHAVRKSRKVVAILTPAYCEDFWNTFEFNIAAYEGIYTKRKVIIPVLLGNISEEDLTPEIRSFIRSKLKSKEVLLFPSSENYIGAFVEQLENVIGHR